MTSVEETRAKFEQELKKAETEDAIMGALAALGLPAPRMVTVHELYGRVAGIHYGDKYSHGDALDWKTVLQLADVLPGVPVTMVRDGCLSFRPTSHCDALTEEQKQRWESETAVCPLLANVEALHGPALELEWFAELPGIGLVEIKCDFRHLPRHIGTYHAKRVEYRGGYRYERATMGVGERLSGSRRRLRPAAWSTSPRHNSRLSGAAAARSIPTRSRCTGSTSTATD